jgi:hypothetical protein
VKNNNKELTFRSLWSWPTVDITVSSAFRAFEVWPRSFFMQEAKTPPMTTPEPRMEDSTV